MQEIELPDGTILEFPAGMADADISAAIGKEYPQFAAQPAAQAGTVSPSPDMTQLAVSHTPQAGGAWDDVKRLPGRMLRSGASIPVGAADFLATPARMALNEAASDNPAYAAQRKMAEKWGVSSGLYKPAVDLGPEYFKPASEQVRRGFDDLGVAGPQGPVEEAVDAAASGVGGAMLGVGLGRGLTTLAGKYLPESFSNLGALLAESPGMQAASSATGAGAADLARQGGASPGMQTAAALFGGALPVAGAGALTLTGRTLGGAKTALDAFTPSGRERIAGHTLNRMSGGPEAAQAALARGAEEFVPGSLPTTAQASGSGGLAVLEKGLASSGPQGAPIQDRYLSQGAAQQSAMNQALDAMAPFGGTLDAADVGARVRGAFDANYGAAKEATRKAYAAIDPDGTTSFNLSPLVESFEQSLGGGRYQKVPAEISSFLGQMKKDMAEDMNVSYRDLQDIRTSLRDMGEQAARTGDAATGRIATMLKGNLDDFLERASQDINGASLRDSAMRQAQEMTKDLQSQGFAPAAVGKITKQLADDILLQEAKRATPGTLTGERTWVTGQMSENLGGFTPEQAAAFRQAKEARTTQGQRFESGANKSMSRRGDSLEGQAVPTAEVPANYFRSGEKGGESMRAFNSAVGDSQEAGLAMRDYILSQARAKSLNRDGTVNLDRMTAWANSHTPALRQIGMEDIAKMDHVRRDLQRAREATSRAAVQGSPTAQNLATQRLVEQSLADRVFGTERGARQGGLLDTLTAIPRGLLERGGRALFEPANEAVRGVLTDAMLDPQYALKLMQGAKTMPRESLSGILGRYSRAYGLSGARNALTAPKEENPKKRRGLLQEF